MYICVYLIIYIYIHIYICICVYWYISIYKHLSHCHEMCVVSNPDMMTVLQHVQRTHIDTWCVGFRSCCNRWFDQISDKGVTAHNTNQIMEHVCINSPGIYFGMKDIFAHTACTRYLARLDWHKSRLLPLQFCTVSTHNSAHYSSCRSVRA